MLAWVVVADPRGRSRSSRSAACAGGPSRSLRGPPRPAAAVLGIQLALPGSEAFMLAHDAREGRVDGRTVRRARVGPLHVGGRVLTDWRDWTLSTAATCCRAPAARRSATPSPTPAPPRLPPAEATDDGS
jgi:hypothetical protein